MFYYLRPTYMGFNRKALVEDDSFLLVYASLWLMTLQLVFENMAAEDRGGGVSDTILSFVIILWWV